jgi:CubicO group peptidase (beta-lactamase class C family)
MTRLLLLIVLLLVRLCAAASVETSKALDGFDAVMSQIMAELKVPGAAAGVIRNGEVVLAKGYGVRGVAGKLRVTPNTVFATGSVTKSFTAAAIASVVDEKKLEWDRPVRDYLPWFRLQDSHATEMVTLRDMLSHRTGMPRHDWIRFMVALDRAELVRRMRYLPFTRPFRQEFQYNNLMFVAAGYVAGEVAAKTWEDLVRERVFQPVGMSASSVSVADMQRGPDFAKPHELRGEVAAEVPFYDYQKFGVGPNGAVNSNITDMLRYLQFMLDNGKVQGRQVISEQQMGEIRKPTMVAGNDTYALGWYVRNLDGARMIEHGGSITGFTAMVRLIPAERLGIVVLNNLGTPLPNVVTDELTARFLGSAKVDRVALLRQIRQRDRSRIAGRATSVSGTKPSLPLGEYAGEYRNPAFGSVRIEQRNGRLAFTAPEFPLELKHFHFDTFEASGRYVQFLLDQRGRISGMSVPLEPTVEPFLFERVRN